MSLSLEQLVVSSNQLSGLPPANPMVERNNITELYASCNRLQDGSLSVITGSVLLCGYECMTWVLILSGFCAGITS